jgi:glycosyltransferase involved in cell wall biosynthesis
LSDSVELTLFLLENRRRFERSTRNRATEWMAYEDAPFPVREVPTLRWSLGERQVYAPRSLSDLPGRGFDAMVLTGWESPAYWAALIRGRQAGARVVGFYESTLATHAFRGGPVVRAREFFFRQLDAVVVPGEASLKAVLAMGVEESKVFVGFNPVDVAGIHAAVGRARLKMNSIQTSEHRFLYIGQLIERKNVATLVEALKLLPDTRDTLTIAGTGHLQGDLERLRDHLGLKGRVAFVGAVPYERVPEILADHDTLVLPSTEEVWGLVVNEALAAGLHVVVSQASGVAASVRDMRGVFLADPESRSLAVAMSASRSSWSGPVEEPAILDKTPEAFADVVLRAAAGV